MVMKGIGRVCGCKGGRSAECIMRVDVNHVTDESGDVPGVIRAIRALMVVK